MTSSTVMTPTSLFSSSTTGMASRLYERDQARGFFLVGVHADADDVRRHDPLQRRLGRHQQQAPQRRDAHQVPPRVDDVEIEDHLHVARRLQLADPLAYRQVFGQREDVRVHDAPGGLLGELEQVADLSGFLRAHQLEHRRRQLLWQVVHQGRRVVGGDLLNQLGDLFGRPVGQQLRGHLGPELGRRLHRQLGAAFDDDRKGGLAVALLQLAVHGGQIGRVLFLEQIEEVGGRTNAQQSSDRVEHDVDSSVRRHQGTCASGYGLRRSPRAPARSAELRKTPKGNTRYGFRDTSNWRGYCVAAVLL